MERSVDERVLAVRNTAVPDKKYHRYAVEFNKCIIPDGVKLTPLTEEEACEALGKTPVQKARMKRNSKKLPGNEPQKVKSFVKKEAATDSAEKGKPNRMIFPVEDEVLIQAARFTIPLKKYLAQRSRDCTYFGTVGLNPTETAIKVREFCKSVTGEVGQTDFSKMDGTHGEFDTGQYIWMYRRAYPRRYHSEIERFMKAHNHRTITTPSCQPDVKPGRINSKWMNLSGKMDTTEANLWRNGFVDYCALREGGLDTGEAFKKIGPKLGDDGLCEMHDQVKVAEDLGFKLKFENAEGGASAVTYLSRIYVAPRVSLYSMADPKRALSRIPVTVNSNVAAGRANKVAGYLITDRDTPVLGEYCRAIQRIYKDVADEKSATPDELRKLSADPYPPCDCRDAAVDVVAKSLGIGADEVLSLEDSLRHVEDVKGLESLRLPGSEPKLHPGATPVASAR